MIDVLNWTSSDDRRVAKSRALALDVLSTAGSGHPGATLSLTPLLYLLFQKVMVHDAQNPNWKMRDKLVLSCGHASLALYIQLHLAGYGISHQDLFEFRKLGSKTPGHPEYGVTPGVETTTGPLGQGLATAIGIALSEQMHRQTSAVKEQQSRVYCVVSDGDLQEGLSFEAVSLAGHYKLGNLTVIFDSNEISIDGDTRQSTTIEMKDYFSALGWGVSEVSKGVTGDTDIPSITKTISNQIELDKPHLIIMQSEIGWPSPNYKNSSFIHGNLLPAAEVELIKEILCLNEELPIRFESKDYSEIQTGNETRKLRRIEKDEIEDEPSIDMPDVTDVISKIEFPAAISTRKANGIILEAIKERHPWTIGGSADLTESNGLKLGNLYQSSIKNGIRNNLIYGVREHAMASISNGMALDPQNIIYCATYLGFSDYQKPAVRLSALMDVPVTYIWTHDSIALGADGPTHQPIEHLAALRAIPNFAVIRPGSANELKGAWIRILEDRKPVGLILSRQDLENSHNDIAYPMCIERGGYIASQNFNGSNPDVVIVATGSELALAVQVSRLDSMTKWNIRVVSMLCWEWFCNESVEYRQTVLPTMAKLFVSLEAASTFGWEKFTGINGLNIGIDTFGKSGSSNDLMEEFGFTLKSVESKIVNRLNELEVDHK